MPRARSNNNMPQFADKLILFRYMLHLLGLEDIKRLSQNLNTPEEEGIHEESGISYYCLYLCSLPNRIISDSDLKLYDQRIQSHTTQISEGRGKIRWKYYQYISLLFTEIYLDHFFADADAFAQELNTFLEQKSPLDILAIEPFDKERLNKLAFMCATGSGKTLLLHVNLLQYLYYFRKASRRNPSLTLNKILLLTPNENLSKQHKQELDLSGIPSVIFSKDGREPELHTVVIIDVNKLAEEGRDKTVSVDSFESNNLLLVDEGHRGLSGDVWFDFRKRLASDGFTMEYSATFKQALNADSTKREDVTMMSDYGKSIIIDYSYKYFYEDGYGKDYRIYNLREVGVVQEQKELYLIGCLMAYYQQKKYYAVNKEELAAFQIEDPLLVFVGNRVTAATKKTDASETAELTDVQEVICFMDRFICNREKTIQNIACVISGNTGLIDGTGRDLFYQNFEAIRSILGNLFTPEDVYADMMAILFNTGKDSMSRLHIAELKQVPGEIALKIGQYGTPFGVISVGDTAKLRKLCEEQGIVTESDEFLDESLFENINKKTSKINVLIGSRKFTEGWNSWRVSTMGLINFAKGEGSQAIQLFGRGVRLHGYKGCLKRSNSGIERFFRFNAPRFMQVVETLTIFGVKAQYMEDFRKFLEMEGAPTNDHVDTWRLPVVSRFSQAKPKKLRVIRLKKDANFKKQSKRLLLDVPQDDFMQYLLKSVTVIDCLSKIQSIVSTFSMKLETAIDRQSFPIDALDVIDYQRIYDELEQYKNERGYYNICIDQSKLRAILAVDGWFKLLIPQENLRITEPSRLENMTDFAIMALKSYMDKFFKFEKERWETPLLEYDILDEEDNNFVQEYTINYTSNGSETDAEGRELKEFIDDVQGILNTHSALPNDKTTLNNYVTAFDFRNHLYAPLISVKKGMTKLQISPVSLNEGETTFVHYLRSFVEQNATFLDGKSLYLLRNKSRAGMGFFEAGNFYPDFILWIDTPEVQYISFIDPKGLTHFMPSDPKVLFFQTIKEVEARLAPTAKDKKIFLNSFIMSETPANNLRYWWHLERPEREAMNVYTLDDAQCVEKMMDKILSVE